MMPARSGKRKENIDFRVYGTPLESTTYKFAKCLQKRFGVIPGVTDKNYITNSYHVHVTENIDAFYQTEIRIPVPGTFTGWSNQLCGSSNMQDNLDAVLSVMKFIYENIMYAELKYQEQITARYVAMMVRFRL